MRNPSNAPPPQQIGNVIPPQPEYGNDSQGTIRIESTLQLIKDLESANQRIAELEQIIDESRNRPHDAIVAITNTGLYALRDARDDLKNGDKLYTSPIIQPAEKLTDEYIRETAENLGSLNLIDMDIDFARAIEKKLRGE